MSNKGKEGRFSSACLGSTTGGATIAKSVHPSVRDYPIIRSKVADDISLIQSLGWCYVRETETEVCFGRCNSWFVRQRKQWGEHIRDSHSLTHTHKHTLS